MEEAMATTAATRRSSPAGKLMWVLIAIAGAVILNTVVQEPVATAFATSGVRL